MQKTNNTMQTTLNRTTPPAFRSIETVDVPAATRSQLDNGVPVFTIGAGTQDVVRIELVFDAGSSYQDRPLQAAVCNALLSAGTTNRTAQEIAGEFDFYGAYINTATDMDYASVTLYTLNKFLEPTLALFKEVVLEASFPEREIETHLRNARQEFAVNQEKVNVLARRWFRQTIYGTEHPYGTLVAENDFETLTRDELVRFKNTHYHAGGCQIFVAGNPPENLAALLNQYFGQGWEKGEAPSLNLPELDALSTKRRFVEKADAIQSAIRIGRRMPGRSHPDYMPLQLLNAVLGGYFGSRLMSNIREDKGYTYGIGSAVVAWKHSSHFFITTEVGAEVTENAIKEIKYELAQLRDELIPEDELQLVKNYLLGSLLKNLDGPFALADRLKPLFLVGEDESYYHRFVEAIHTTTPAQLRELAARYWQEDDLLELIAGNKNAISTL